MDTNRYRIDKTVQEPGSSGSRNKVNLSEKSGKVNRKQKLSADLEFQCKEVRKQLGSERIDQREIDQWNKLDDQERKIEERLQKVYGDLESLRHNLRDGRGREQETVREREIVQVDLADDAIE